MVDQEPKQDGHEESQKESFVSAGIFRAPIGATHTSAGSNGFL